MKIFKPLMLFAVLICGNSYAQRMNIKTTAYPQTKKGEVTDTYFDTSVPDPYRWLEDDRSEDTKAWVTEQNKVTQAYLSQIPYRNTIRQRLEKLWNYERYSAPFKEGSYTYFYKNDGLQSQSVLYRQAEGGQPEIFLDPNKFSKDGTTSLSGISFSKDGSLAAYQTSAGGSDWSNAVVMRATDRSIIGDTLKDIKFSGLAWKGNEGFYYSTYEKPKEGSLLSGMTQYHKLFYHKLGTPQSEDKLIFGGEQTPRRYIGAYLTEDERYLVITAANSTTGNELYFQDLSKPDSKITNIVDNMDNVHTIIANVGSKLYIHTNLYAPTYRLVVTDAADPQPRNWKNLIAKTENVLEVSTAGGKLFAHYLKDATTFVQQYDMNGKLEHAVALPSVGTASGFSAKQEDKDIYYTFTSYTYPSTIFKYDIATGRSEVYKRSGVKFDPSLYESKQVFYKSKDGTRVPMIITYKKGTVLNEHNPTLLYAYGGFGVSLTPAFSTSNIILLEQGGIYAVANLRGGGEYGETWHKAGTKLRKQNVFDDFIAAAEYLIKSKYTSKEFLAIAGGSNGGLLVGATITQRPDLCQVAFPAVGVMDMLRYNKFTAGAGWAYDYGTAEDSEGMFKYLYRYSPYHALKPASYPATMVTTADHDDRVVPAHSFKFAARLQECQKGPAPTLIRIETNAGHGAGRSTAQIIGQETDKWAFMFVNMGVDYK
ncbi:prolyl oligopeptidase family serine peptidase [Mucilaginibacter daejeonensis]|uniref:prolyl oligopeptidase family serine peptidase n=1 Tax=Mucilaginibacter daejeonensis TaxID=398049 RepID=UPI001D1767CE|nr:prolyl oligopeptidase family serine peptidase [Mucilaginibacter daejeonensis]UEG53467.1 prolyl oligopeptidase family serine peptidase [Mucilaginibacter daejeonensis]